MFIVPILLAMAIGIVFWHRPALVAALVATAVGLSFGYLASAPFSCYERASGGSGQPTVHQRGCSRLLLSDIEGEPQAGDRWLALGIGVGAAVALGTVAGVIGRRMERRSREPKPA